MERWYEVHPKLTLVCSYCQDMSSSPRCPGDCLTNHRLVGNQLCGGGGDIEMLTVGGADPLVEQVVLA